MKKVLECAYCDGMASLVREPLDLDYRKEEFRVQQHFYRCNTCKEEFTTTESDTITLTQLHNQYRERHHIPFPEQLKALRENYNLSAKKMSEVLGLGVNGYSNYEKGEIPKPAIGNLISTIYDPTIFKRMIQNARNQFSDNGYQRAINHVNELIEEQEFFPSTVRINQICEASSLTGYRKPNLKKIANLLIVFIKTCSEDFNDRLKLNKLLFYTDFLNYKSNGFSVTGITYRAIQYGPVPTYYDNIFNLCESEGYLISTWHKRQDGGASEIFTTEVEQEPEAFTSDEQTTIDTVIEKFKQISSWDLVELSHKEKGWIDLNASRDVMDYQLHAYDLVGIQS